MTILKDEIARLEDQIRDMRAELKVLEAQRDALYLKDRSAAPVGSVISWKAGQGRGYGRVTKATPAYNGGSVDYKVIRIRVDGSEGDATHVSSYDHPTLVSEEYEDGKVYAVPKTGPVRPLKETAARISAHLKRMEKDPQINPVDSVIGARNYFMAGAHASGRGVSVLYISYQGATSLTSKEAEAYLDWLDAGNNGTHREAIRE